jgi:hypothetical protein
MIRSSSTEFMEDGLQLGEHAILTSSGYSILTAEPHSMDENSNYIYAKSFAGENEYTATSCEDMHPANCPYCPSCFELNSNNYQEQQNQINYNLRKNSQIKRFNDVVMIPESPSLNELQGYEASDVDGLDELKADKEYNEGKQKRIPKKYKRSGESGESKDPKYVLTNETVLINNYEYYVVYRRPQVKINITTHNFLNLKLLWYLFYRFHMLI